MVALKPARPRRRSSREARKQERRGGIETPIRFYRFVPLDRGSRNAVVALKPARAAESGKRATGSRNAVVALKPSSAFRVSCTRRRKQERRGGIETPGDRRHVRVLPAGSRNAVVALKPKPWPAGTSSSHGSRNAVVALKPGLGEASETSSQEAGTPWWH